MDFSLLIPFVAVSIPVVALLRGPLKEWLRVKERSLEIAASDAAEKAAQYAAKTERLEQRMAVLERIITDRSNHLADEIESLRDKPLN
jgi:ABC-type phosphate transport system auxiliary subunit